MNFIFICLDGYLIACSSGRTVKRASSPDPYPGMRGGLGVWLQQKFYLPALCVVNSKLEEVDLLNENSFRNGLNVAPMVTM